MDFNDKRVKRVIAIGALVLVVAMIATMILPVRSHRRGNAVVTTNCEKSAEAIVGKALKWELLKG